MTQKEEAEARQMALVIAAVGAAFGVNEFEARHLAPKLVAELNTRGLDIRKQYQLKRKRPRRDRHPSERMNAEKVAEIKAWLSVAPHLSAKEIAERCKVIGGRVSEVVHGQYDDLLDTPGWDLIVRNATFSVEAEHAQEQSI